MGSLSLGLWGLATERVEPVSVLMPAPFADATAELVSAFNRSHPRIALSVTRGPLETEAVSDLAISSLLLGESPYDLLLMDVSWTPKYAAAGWLEPLDAWLGPDALADLAPGADLGNAFGGQLWRFPLLADMGLLYWRTRSCSQPVAAMAAGELSCGSLFTSQWPPKPRSSSRTTQLRPSYCLPCHT